MSTKRTRVLLGSVALGWTVCAAIFSPPAAHADPTPPNCEVHPWGFLGLTQKRIICDGPIRADGSWMRRRIIGTPAYYEDATTNCYGGSYYMRCTTSPGGPVAATVQSDDTYPVRPDSVLGDEPGHMPAVPVVPQSQQRQTVA